MQNYDWVTQEMYKAALRRIIGSKSKNEILSMAWDVLAERLNNEALESLRELWIKEGNPIHSNNVSIYDRYCNLPGPTTEAPEEVTCHRCLRGMKE